MIPEEATLNECPYFSPDVYTVTEDTKTANRDIFAIDNQQMKIILIVIVIAILVYYLSYKLKW